MSTDKNGRRRVLFVDGGGARRAVHLGKVPLKAAHSVCLRVEAILLYAATVTDQLRRAVRGCGQTRYAIAKATGVPESVLSRFVAGGHGLRSGNIDRLCAHLALELAARPGGARKKGR